MTRKSPRRVVHMVPAPFDPVQGIVGGAERYAFELARHMAERVSTTLLTYGERPERYRIGHLDVQVLGPYHRIRGSRNNPLALSLVPALGQADVIHCHQQHILSSSLAAIVGRVTGKRVFVTDLGGGGWDLSSYISTDSLYHGHLHISEYSRRVFRHQARANASVILGGVDSRHFTPDPQAPTRHVLFVGRLLPHKGVDVLIRALPAGSRLLIVGRAYHPAYHSELVRLAAGKDVEFLLEANDERLLLAYREASCIVLPSVYTDMYGNTTTVPELLGQTLLEGMACGVPGICTNVASLPEVVDDGRTGFVVPPNDPAALTSRLAWVAGNPLLRREMGTRAREVVDERFVWSAVVERCLDAYSASDAGRASRTYD